MKFRVTTTGGIVVRSGKTYLQMKPDYSRTISLARGASIRRNDMEREVVILDYGIDLHTVRKDGADV